jgi:uncharacterized membrane protein
MKTLFNNTRQQLDRYLTEKEQILFLSCAFSTALVVARVVYTGERMFAFMLWNLFLAILPYMLSRFIVHKKEKGMNIFFLVAWLLLLPNAFYIITDLFHLKERIPMPLWFDLALIFSCAWNGLLLGVASLKHIESVLDQRFHAGAVRVILHGILLLNAFGIYLGRYLRFNSWDVLTDPFSLIFSMLDLLIHPVQNRFDWSMIVCYSILLILIYETLRTKMRYDR